MRTSFLFTPGERTLSCGGKFLEGEGMGVAVVVTWDGAGNFPPTRAVVRELVARGHSVHVLAYDCQAEAVRADGAVFRPLQDVIQLRSTDRESNKGTPWMIQNVAMAGGYGTSLARAIEELRPGLILVDFFLAAALRTGAASGVPTVALGHTIYSPFQASPIGALVEACTLAHIFSYREFDPAPSFSERIRFYAPYAGPAKAGAGERTRPAIIVSLSTSFQDQAELIQRLCDATRELDADVLVTTGGAFEAGAFTAGANTKVTHFVAHDLALPDTDLLITHAGHGTVMAGARHGVPMLCIPMGRDQPTVAVQAERVGLCKVAAPDASAAALNEMIRAALQDRALKARCRAFANSVADAPDVQDAAFELETLMG